MFRDVSGCSGMFHVPGFIDDLTQLQLQLQLIQRGEIFVNVVLYLNFFFFFLQSNSVEQFWYHVKGLNEFRKTKRLSFHGHRG